MAKRKVWTRDRLFKSLKTEAHRLWSLAVRARDGKCVLCQNRETLQAHHWIVHARGSLQVRFIPENGVTLCYTCHIYKVHGRGDADLMDRIRDYMVPRFLSPERYEEIKRLGNKPVEFELEDLGQAYCDLASANRNEDEAEVF